MNRKVAGFILAVLYSSWLYAFPCFLTIVKEDCWLNYDVNVSVLDTTSNQVSTQINIPKGKAWQRLSFECQAAQKFMYLAKFEPVIWDYQKDKTYRATHYWSLPDKVKENITAWNISVCFSKDFAEVPLPPSASGHCKCNFNDIPPPE